MVRTPKTHSQKPSSSSSALPLPVAPLDISAAERFATVYDSSGITSIGTSFIGPAVDLSQRSVSRKRSAHGPPSSGIPSSSKLLKSTSSFDSSLPSAVGMARTHSAPSSSSSHPLPVNSPIVPSPLSLSQTDLDSDDLVLSRLDSLDMALIRGDLDLARRRMVELRRAYNSSRQ